MSRVDEMLREYASTADFLFDQLSLKLVEDIWQRMEELSVTQAELARRMGVTRARVSQLLRGSDNLTLKTLACIAHALDASVAVTIQGRTQASTSIASGSNARRS